MNKKGPHWRDEKWWADNWDSASEADHTRRLFAGYGYNDEEIAELVLALAIKEQG